VAEAASPRRLGAGRRPEPDPTFPAPGFQRGLGRLSAQVARALAAQGLELTLGGEPTFCPEEPGERPEWRTEALGGEKRTLAEWLALHLAHDLGRGAVVSYHTGKDFGDEGGPRFCIRLTWVEDGPPLWRDYGRLHARGGAAEPADATAAGLARLARRLSARIEARGGRLPFRVAFVPDGAETPATPAGSRPPAVVAVAAEAGAPLLKLPSFATPADYVALVGAIASAVEEDDLPPLRIGGAEPPIPLALGTGSTFRSFTIVPDVGVIEVNLPPAVSLAEAHRTVRTVYAAARRVGLRGLRYHYDGDVQESGGGAQIVAGGPTPERSPFVARPRLVLGLTRYLANHPGLSYAFAGAFIGPTSQGPRPDESGAGRFELLRAALDGLEALGERAATADLVQATLGHVLRDNTGNTHRAELNLEKYWNPFLPDIGRLGLLELRAIAAQPSADACGALFALVAAIVARLALTPYREPLVDWGRKLRDRFTLPYFLERDLDAVVLDLVSAGLGLRREWLAPHVESRYPRLGAAALATGATIELRRALEPWPVLGDLTLENSKTRAADCSTRRVELSLASDRAARPPLVLVNGVKVPLRPTPAGDRLLAGVRYRRFDSPFGLLPFVRTHEPLEVEAYDPDTGAFLGGARLHDWRAGGGPYPGFPADAREAEARRRERCVAIEQPSLAPAEALAFGREAGTADAPAEGPGGDDATYVVDLLERLPGGGRRRAAGAR